MYKHADLRPWDPRNDVYQYEYNYVIQTKTRHQTPMIRTASIVSVDPQTVVSFSVLFSSLQHSSPKGYIEYSKGLFLWFFSLFTKLLIAEQSHKTGVRFEAVAAVNIEVMLLWDLMAFSVADITSIPEAGIWQTIWCCVLYSIYIYICTRRSHLLCFTLLWVALCLYFIILCNCS